jgi:adenylosuccinate synthase
MMGRKIDMVVDLQFGSTGKGLLAGWLAMRNRYDTIITAWAPNAGHTYIDAAGRKFVHTMLANGVVSPSLKRILVGPGSVLDLDKFREEILACKDLIVDRKVSIFIHPHAAVVTDEHRAIEAVTMTAIGSTKKGVGQAVVSKINRNPSQKTVAKDFGDHPIFDIEEVVLIKDPLDYIAIYEQSSRVLIEGAQGFGLSIHHGFYPYTTSRDVTPSQILADCGVPFIDHVNVIVYGTARTFPIRVANRFNEEGKQVGFSGPHYPDQVEISWADLGMEPELTTVTKLPRRIFTYSKQQMSFAKRMCCPDVVFLNFVNYLKSREQFVDIAESIMEDGTQLMVGVGPSILDVLEYNPWPGADKVWDSVQQFMDRINMARPQ